MPILMNNTLMWVDCNTSIVLDKSPAVILSHLIHVAMLIDGKYELRTEGLWMPCGDVFGVDDVITYRVMEFGTKFLVLNYSDREVVVPITPQLLNQLSVLVDACKGGSNG